MKRRALLVALGVSMLTNALPLRAQRTARPFRVGFVMGGGPGSDDSRRFLQAFVEGMRAQGYRDGANLALAMRYYGRDQSAIPALADELIAWQPDVLVANVSSTAVILVKKTSTIPIVMVIAVDAVAEGLVKSLARPGGNLTGMSGPGTIAHAKLIELARDLLPRARRIAFLFNPGHALSKSYSAVAAQAAKALELEMVPLQVSGASDMEQFADGLSLARPDALVVATDAVLFGLRDAIVQTALKARLPTFAYLPEFAASGAVASLGWDLTTNYRGAARYVDRILKGAKPGDLPVEQPTQFELVINLKSAKTIGMIIPPAMLVRANRVIE